VSANNLEPDFSKIDAVLKPWAQKRKLQVYDQLDADDAPGRLIVWRKQSKRFGRSSLTTWSLWVDSPADSYGRVYLHAHAAHFPDNESGVIGERAALNWRLDQLAELPRLKAALSAIYKRLLRAPFSN